MDKQRILVVDDEETLCEALQFNLEVEGYEVDVAYSAEEALTKDISSYSLILLDVMMGEMSGFKMARLLKHDPATADIPIIFCTARDTEDDMIAGLNLGADDYIAKPFSIRNVLARVKTVLRRSKSARGNDEREDVIRYDGIVIDSSSKQCTVDGQQVKLPRKEFEILSLLVSHPGRIFSRNDILAKIWGTDVIVSDRTIDVNITRLRQKIGRYGNSIITRSGYGYGFQP